MEEADENNQRGRVRSIKGPQKRLKMFFHSKPSESVSQPGPSAPSSFSLTFPPPTTSLKTVISLHPRLHPSQPIVTRMVEISLYISSDLCEKWSTRAKGSVNPQNADPPLGRNFTSVSSQDTSSLSLSFSRFPQSFPLQPGRLSRFLSLFHLSINLRKITCTVYRINIWF